jgi:hypothetical protein
MDKKDLHSKVLKKSKHQLQLKKFYDPYKNMDPADSKDKYNFPSKNDIIPQLPEIFLSKGKRHGK